ncbi:BsuBI/PstI restriction endonuclease C-terminus [Zhouia amylolytica]|uniref:BsuBI/PstI restriction endonuclease C-terminus n=1 Tax=Zhouia amylolytica TaxID=376730 RepID=A0A1I6T3F5_9FLAO|nr:BsuBI/PstI family type II restriction endonuclease [Zhouia amylolytica]SFS83775.1 BsuBI/PstI restriction endonuclease C-terminus [Zhouia amylolytica]
MTDLKELKLQEAKQILKALKLPKKQTNDRSAWVFLSLANIKPNTSWNKCQAPLLPTYIIMEFIRNNYGMDYKPNSRETIRRQTLHQFEQARIIDRNRDNPKRPTNSKDNNYSLNEPILEILRAFPAGDWKEKVDAFLQNTPSLKEEYQKKRNIDKIPVKLPNGKELTLSPGKHNQLHADIVHEFCPRFIGAGGIVLYMGDTASSRSEEGGKLMHLESEYLQSLGVPPMSHDKLPDVVVYDTKNKWLFLIEAVTSHGPVSPKRWKELEEALKDCKVGKVYVTAFPDTAEFKRNVADIAWETEVWMADKPDHMIHFNGDRFLGPHS